MDNKAGFQSILRTLIAYLLLPLVGWWISSAALWPPPLGDLLASFGAEPARLAYVAIVLVTALATGYLSATTPVSAPIQARSAMLHWRNIALEITMVLGPFSDHREQMVMGSDAWPRWLGLALFVIGMAFALWSSALRSQAIRAERLTLYEPVLVTSGPYRRLRYPDYLGQIVYVLGAALVFRSWIGLGSTLALILFIIALIREEEDLARTQLGNRWLSYCQSSWKLIPFIF